MSPPRPFAAPWRANTALLGGVLAVVVVVVRVVAGEDKTRSTDWPRHLTCRPLASMTPEPFPTTCLLLSWMDGWMVGGDASTECGYPSATLARHSWRLLLSSGVSSQPASQPASHPKPRGPDPCALLAVDGRGPPHRPSASRSGLIAPGRGADATQARMPGPPTQSFGAVSMMSLMRPYPLSLERHGGGSPQAMARPGPARAGLVCFWFTIPGSTQWTDGSSGAVMRAHSGGHSTPLEPPGTLHKLRWRRPASHLGMW